MLSIKEYLTTIHRHDFIHPRHSERSSSTMEYMHSSYPFTSNWVGWTCRFCEKISGLDEWQIKAMPVEMAKCAKSDIPITLRQKYVDSVNCFGEPVGKGGEG